MQHGYMPHFLLILDYTRISLDYSHRDKAKENPTTRLAPAALRGPGADSARGLPSPVLLTRKRRVGSPASHASPGSGPVVQAG